MTEINGTVGWMVALVIGVITVGTASRFQPRPASQAIGTRPRSFARTIGQLRDASFTFHGCDALLEKEATRLGGTGRVRELPMALVTSEAILCRWFEISCLLDRITGNDKPARGTYFDSRAEVLSSVARSHKALAPRVGAYAAELMKGLSVEVDGPDDTSAPSAGAADLLHDLSALRDRLHACIACGLCSSGQSGDRVTVALRDLGFEVRPSRRRLWPGEAALPRRSGSWPKAKCMPVQQSSKQ